MASFAKDDVVRENWSSITGTVQAVLDDMVQVKWPRRTKWVKAAFLVHAPRRV